MAATLVLGTFAVTTTKSSTAFAYMRDQYIMIKKTRDGSGNGNGNTIIIQKCKQIAIQSGWDNDQEQECENLICTHPGENATCTQEEAAVVVPIPTPVNKTCEQCFTSLLTQAQINSVIAQIHSLPQFPELNTLPELCELLKAHAIGGRDFITALSASGVTEATITDLFTCLRQAGIVFGE
jgi:hypothetical protein